MESLRPSVLALRKFCADIALVPVKKIKSRTYMLPRGAPWFEVAALPSALLRLYQVGTGLTQREHTRLFVPEPRRVKILVVCASAERVDIPSNDRNDCCYSGRCARRDRRVSALRAGARAAE